MNIRQSSFLLLLAIFFPISAVAEVAIDDRVAITRSGLVLNRANNTYDTTLTLRNISHAPIEIPIAVV